MNDSPIVNYPGASLQEWFHYFRHKKGSVFAMKPSGIRVMIQCLVSDHQTVLQHQLTFQRNEWFLFFEIVQLNSYSLIKILLLLLIFLFICFFYKKPWSSLYFSYCWNGVRIGMVNLDSSRRE